MQFYAKMSTVSFSAVVIVAASVVVFKVYFGGNVAGQSGLLGEIPSTAIRDPAAAKHATRPHFDEPRFAVVRLEEAARAAHGLFRQ